MGALYLKDLADKTRRGLRGRIEAGNSRGDNSYGYKVVRKMGPDGDLIRGDRKKDPAEVKVIRRIFKDYATGKSPRHIAQQLNKEKVPGQPAEDGAQAPSMATENAALVFSITSFISVGLSGTACATSRTHTQASVFPA